ncbi:two-component sensor histidine kinase [Cytophagales bacterium WSM2-2]|nr:two-component sensor histidine kinase [Cytophagales bacterium WSM2-2]
MQIRSRLTLQFTVLVSAILIAAFSILYTLVWQNNHDAFRKRLHDKALTSAILLLKVDQVDSALLKIIDLSKRDVLYKENISVYDSSYRELYTNDESLEFHVSKADYRSVLSGKELFFKHGDFDVVGIPYEYKGSKYVVLSGAIDKDGTARLAALRGLIYILTPLLVAIVGLAGWIFAGKALKPIVRVMKEVQEMSPTELGQRLTGSDNPDEIGKLISIFNQLLDRIEDAFQLQKSFVSSVSHELNNPLTKITSQLEVTLLSERDNEDYKKILLSVLEDIRDLNRLSSSLLELAYLNQGSQNFTMSAVRVDEILWETREDITSTTRDYRVQIHIDKMPENQEELCTQAHPQLLKTALTNIIENACKFSSDHTAFVFLSCESKRVIIRVVDKGPGIRKDDLEKIFQPFYRTNNTSKVRGHGIGLPLAQRIISIHQGTIAINSSPGVGTEVSVALKMLSGF